MANHNQWPHENGWDANTLDEHEPPLPRDLANPLDTNWIHTNDGGFDAETIFGPPEPPPSNHFWALEPRPWLRRHQRMTREYVNYTPGSFNGPPPTMERNGDTYRMVGLSFNHDTNRNHEQRYYYQSRNGHRIQVDWRPVSFTG